MLPPELHAYQVQLLPGKEELRDLDTDTNSRREGHGTQENSEELITKKHQLRVTNQKVETTKVRSGFS